MLLGSAVGNNIAPYPVEQEAPLPRALPYLIGLTRNCSLQ
jgi:hypothetical protein